MEVIRIDTMAQFDAVQSDWERAYALDTHAHIFVSWAWLRGWFEITPYEWFVLAAREEKNGRFVAFFPLALRPLYIRTHTVLRELHMGGKPFSDYTGFVCMSNYEASAITVFSSYIKDHHDWDLFYLAEVVDARLDDMPSHFVTNGCHIESGTLLPCPYVRLSDTWEGHMRSNMSVRSRAGVRRAFRRIEELPGFCATHPRKDDLDKHIDALMTMWESRHGRMSRQMKDRYQHIFRHAFRMELLRLNIIWDGHIPVAALAAFADPMKRVIYAHTTAFNEEYARLSPGKAIVAYGIRDAIEQGFSVYDLLLGGEPYKYTYGATERRTSSVVLVRNGLRVKIGRLLLWLRSFMQTTLRAKPRNTDMASDASRQSPPPSKEMGS